METPPNLLSVEFTHPEMTKRTITTPSELSCCSATTVAAVATTTGAYWPFEMEGGPMCQIAVGVAAEIDAGSSARRPLSSSEMAAIVQLSAVTGGQSSASRVKLVALFPPTPKLRGGVIPTR